MELAGKKSFNKWVKVDDTFEVKVDYPTMEQEITLQEYLMDTGVSDIIRMSRYSRHFIKCTVKEWRGKAVETEKLKLVNNEMEKTQWLRLVKDIDQSTSLWNLINEELEFTAVDKKKSS